MVKARQTTILIYLLVIQKLSNRGKEIKNNDLAKVLNVTPSSVSEMLDKLRNDGYLEGNFKLTNKGKRFIQNYRNRFI
ncbi:metal-dependent transcriptional regulator [Enterococcus sp. DIV0086]|uniref:metal-dependent transcriptional regulator n=1 Tax=Enterococcus sp. DIV0086 TaxID=2774655 RepID=UPI003D26AFA9